MNCPKCGKEMQKQHRPKMKQGMYYCGECTLIVIIEELNAKQAKLFDFEKYNIDEQKLKEIDELFSRLFKQ